MYSKYKIDVEYKNIQYEPVVKNVAKPGFTFEEWYHNGGSHPLTGKFSKTKAVTASFTWSITEGESVWGRIGRGGGGSWGLQGLKR